MTEARKALVTGGSEGLGLHTASELAARGYAVTVVGRRPERLDAVVKGLPGSGHRFFRRRPR
jgi:NAD(P)-dependent dehydrogenase (short-subunit alcohol dehydrogenase family)